MLFIFGKWNSPVLRQIPFVEGYDAASATFIGITRYGCILVRRPRGPIDHQNGDVTTVHRLERHNDAVFFKKLGRFTLSPDARRVHENKFFIVLVEHGIHRIAGGSRFIGDDATFRPQKFVDQRGLSHVGFTDDGYFDHVAGFLCFPVGRQTGDDIIDQFRDSLTMFGGNGINLLHAQ